MPIPFLAWGAIALGGYITKKVCDTVVQSKEIANSSNPPTNTQALQQEVTKPLTDKLDNLDKTISDKIKEQLGDSTMTPREKKEVLEKVKEMSKEEKADLLKQLKNENSAEQDAINKSLKDQLEKQEKASIQLAKELKEARENDNPNQVAKIAQMMKDNDKNQQTTRLALKKAEEEAKKQAKMLEEYFKVVEQDKPWFLDMNFKSPWLWGIIVFSLILCIFLTRMIMWIWGKIKGVFSGEN